jgi:hypothetical protein
MPTNFYINNIESSPEQNLIHDLLIESIKFYGIDMYWLPRKTSIFADQVLGEDVLSEYVQAYPIEMYIKNVEGFEGEGDFLSKFGLDIRDRATFTMATRRFDQLEAKEILPQGGDPVPFVRPREGDLVYFPLSKDLFQIQFVEHESMFYTAGTLPVYDLRCELFVYNNEVVSTGIADVDDLIATYKLTSAMPDGTTVDNKKIQDQANTILDHSDPSPFGSF